MNNLKGYAKAVWGGWVWVTDHHIEHRWSKRPTEAECTQVVREVVERIGEVAAFDEEAA